MSETAATGSISSRTHLSGVVRELPHITALDGVRGLAIVLVVLHHNIRFIFPSGFAGVDVFFVLSGFLITSILLKQLGAPDLRHQIWLFYVRRCLRLFPALFALLAVFLAFTLIFDKGRHLQGILYGATYTSNWASAFSDQVPPSLQHLWSLAQEEQFYLVWPLFLVVMMWMRLQRRTIMLTTASLLAIGPLAGVWLTWSGAPSQRLYFGLDTHSTGILLGCLLGQIYIWLPESGLFKDRRFTRFAGLVAVGALIVFAVGLRGDFPNWVQGLVTTPLFSLLAAAVLITAVACEGGILIACLRNPISRRLGLVSYSFYLWHIPAMYFVARLLAERVSFRFTLVISIALAYALAEASYRYIESPFLRLKSRYEPPTDPDRAPLAPGT